MDRFATSLNPDWPQAEAYLSLLNGLAPEKKLLLAERLIESVRKPRTSPEDVSKDEFIPEMTAEELIADLRNARAFIAKREDF